MSFSMNSLSNPIDEPCFPMISHKNPYSECGSFLPVWSAEKWPAWYGNVNKNRFKSECYGSANWCIWALLFGLSNRRSNGTGIVALFVSTFENKIDSKGRLSVPAPFRAALESSQTALYLYKSLLLPCMEGCGSERISQIVDAIDTMDSLSEEVATLTTMLSSAQEMKLDSEGRILLSADFIDYAGLSHSAIFAGIGRSFQIWHPETFRDREASARENAKKFGVPKLTLSARTSPGGT